MPQKPNKPVCVIVGVGPGNGASFARKFAEQGYQVALLARHGNFITDLAGRLEGARAYACDVTDADSIEQAFASIREELGEVSTLIYNPGAGVWKNVEEIKPEEFEQSWRINALGSFLVSRQVIPAMKMNKSGNIIFIGATASRRGGIKSAAFAPAKAAQKSLVESMARHLGPMGIHVALVIVDGVIDTPSTRKMMPGKPDEFFMLPDELADTVLHLNSQKPSAWSSEIEVRPFCETW